MRFSVNAQRHRHQERRLGSKFGLNIPALDAAADLTASKHFGTYKQSTDGNTIVLDEVAIFWKRGRRLSSAELL